MREKNNRFSGKNKAAEIAVVRRTLDIGAKMWVRSLEKCLKVGKLTKIYRKLPKSSGIALAKVGEMCETFERFDGNRLFLRGGRFDRVGGGVETALSALVHILEKIVRIVANLLSTCDRLFLSGALGHLLRYAPRTRSSKYYSTPAAGSVPKPYICNKIPGSKGA